MLTHTEDHPICVAVHEAIVRSENSALGAEERAFALDCIEDALAHSTAEMLEQARLRLEDATKKPVQRSCQGCGWPIDTTVLQWYCRICDPNGKREEVRAEAELFEQHGI